MGFVGLRAWAWLGGGEAGEEGWNNGDGALPLCTLCVLIKLGKKRRGRSEEKKKKKKKEDCKDGEERE